VTARHELPVIKTGKRGVGFRRIDSIGRQEERRPASKQQGGLMGLTIGKLRAMGKRKRVSR
jgi:hypothetical protein